MIRKSPAQIRKENPYILQKKFTGIYRDRVFEVKVDNLTYKFALRDGMNTGGYAKVSIQDPITRDIHIIHGYIELNGHTFLVKWEEKYDIIRDNWSPMDTIIITVI